MVKGKTRNTTGTSQMRHLKIVHHRFRQGFREGKTPKPKKAADCNDQSCNKFSDLKRKKKEK